MYELLEKATLGSRAGTEWSCSTLGLKHDVTLVFNWWGGKSLAIFMCFFLFFLFFVFEKAVHNSEPFQLSSTLTCIVHSYSIYLPKGEIGADSGIKPFPGAYIAREKSRERVICCFHLLLYPFNLLWLLVWAWIK